MLAHQRGHIVNTYLFYDLETSGRNICFDQILQFAAIRTDMEFNELESWDFRIQLRPDVIPAPYAIKTNRVSPAMAQEGRLEADGVRFIHRLLNKPGTISIGYNSLGFDDLFLRFAFHRHLLPVYTHQYKNRCYRADLLPITLFYHLYQPQLLPIWPRKEDGKISLRLEDLNHANQLVTGMAHDALVDVRATIALARRWRQKEDSWDYAMRFYDKDEDQARIDSLPTMPLAEDEVKVAFLLHTLFGPDNFFQAAVILLGVHEQDPKRSIWLRLDSEKLPDVLGSEEQFKVIQNKKLAEPGFLLPGGKNSRHNRLSPDQREMVRFNWRWLRENPAKFTALRQELCQKTFTDSETLDPDAALYQLGFMSRQQEQLTRRFHQCDWRAKTALLPQFEGAWQQLALRLIGRNQPQALSPPWRAKFEQYLQQVQQATPDHPIPDFKGGRRYTFTDAQADLSTLQQDESLDDEQRQLLAAWEPFWQQRA